MKNAKIIVVLIFLFSIDLVRPFGYGLNVEFLLCGIIFLALHYRVYVSIPCALAFGYAKDVFLKTPYSINMIEFILLCAGIHYLMRLFLLTHNRTRIIAKCLVVFVSLILHSLLNTAQINSILPWYLLQFFIHTSIVYFITDYFLETWIDQYPARSLR